MVQRSEVREDHGARGVLFETWDSYPGGDLFDIAQGTDRTTASRIATFEAPPNRGDFHGTRLRALLSPPSDGEYTFWIEADDVGYLFLSSNENENNKRRIAVDLGWACCGPTASQPIELRSSQRYYIEAIAKESDGPDVLTVSWLGPKVTPRQTIAGDFLTSVLAPAGWDAYPPVGIGATLEVWESRPGGRLTDIPDGTLADVQRQLFAFEAPVNVDDFYGMRLSALLVPPESGTYTFALEADDEGVLLLSSDDDPANLKQIVADNGSNCCGATGSEPIDLVAGNRYYLRAVGKESDGPDLLTVSWQGPGVTPQQVISDRYLLSVDTDQQWAVA